MRAKVFRTLGALLGAALVLLAIPLAKVGPGPAWLNAIPLLLTGALFLRYGITGKTRLIPRKTMQQNLLGEIELVSGQWAGQKHFPPIDRPIYVYFEDDAAFTDEQIEEAWQMVLGSYPALVESVVRNLPGQYPDLGLSDDFSNSHVTLESVYIMSPETVGLTWGLTIQSGKDAEYEVVSKYDRDGFEILGVGH